jgi:hypothetical protein
MKYIFYKLLSAIIFICFIGTANCITNGAIILYRNGATSVLYNYGIVRIYYNGWGNICDDYQYSYNEANVICHQLGYTGVSTYSRAGLRSYGTDYSSMRIDDFDCGSSSYLSFAQCTFSTYIDSGCVSNSYDATVYCYSTRIWNNPFPGMVRLQGGSTSNAGRVEVYCNGQWGTICDDGFGTFDATTVCKQMGYSGYIRYNHLRNNHLRNLNISSDTPIWMKHISSSSTDSCILSRNPCDSRTITTCDHSQDVSVECSE